MRAIAGLVSITAACAYVEPWAALVIGAVAGILVVWSCLFLERTLRIDDPVGAISIHGTIGAWGVLALGLFADGTYAPHADFNGVPGNVTGLFYGNAFQFVAQCVGVIANLLWVFLVAMAFFWVLGRLIGNRVTVPVEFQGLDIPEMGALGYVLPDAKAHESRTAVQLPITPKPALVPPNESKRFSALVEGVDLDLLTRTWSDLCHSGADQLPPPEFKAVYPYMTTMQGNRFRFRGGDPQSIRANLERVLQERTQQAVRVRLE